MKKRNSLLIFFFLFISSTSTFAQKVNVEFLSGEWSCYNRVLKNGETGENVTLNGKPFEPDMELIFSKNDKVTVKEGPAETEVLFILKKNLLKIGTREYKIEKLNKNELILLEVDKDNPYNELLFRRYFKKVTTK